MLQAQIFAMTQVPFELEQTVKEVEGMPKQNGMEQFAPV